MLQQSNRDPYLLRVVLIGGWDQQVIKRAGRGGHLELGYSVCRYMAGVGNEQGVKRENGVIETITNNRLKSLSSHAYSSFHCSFIGQDKKKIVLVFVRIFTGGSVVENLSAMQKAQV